MLGITAGHYCLIACAESSILRRDMEKDGLTGVSTGWSDVMGVIGGEKLPEMAVISRYFVCNASFVTNHTLAAAPVKRKVWGQNQTWLRNSSKRVE
jgi:hypothetical protein